MDYTQHYNLKKPAYGEAVDVKDINDNADITDAQLNTLAGLVAARLLKTDLVNQIINNATKAASAATVYSVNEKVDSAISDLDNITSANTLLYTFKYLPPSFLDNPNSHFKVSGWAAVPYLSLSNTATGAGWGVILGIYDNNNGTPLGRQFVIGTSKCMERRYLNGTWQSWVDK